MQVAEIELYEILKSTSSGDEFRGQYPELVPLVPGTVSRINGVSSVFPGARGVFAPGGFSRSRTRYG